MKNYYSILLCACLLLFSSIACAAINLTNVINGISGSELKNVQIRLKLLQQKAGKELTEDSINEIYERAPKHIIKALQPYGYFQSTVKSSLQKISNDSWQATYNVNLGPEMKITHLTLILQGKGKDDSALQKYISNFPLHEGQKLQTEEYKKAKAQLFKLVNQQGYLTAYFIKQQIVVDIQQNTSKIMLIVNTGPRYYFGPINFSNIMLNTHLLKRYAPFKQGEIYSSTKLLELQNALTSSNYFRTVTVRSHLEQAANYQIPINVKLKLRKREQYILGLGYGTDTGPRLLLGANLRYLNGDGHYINSQATFSPVQNSFQVKYVIPGEHPATDQYNITASLITNVLEQGASSTEQIGLSNIKMFNDWQRILFLNFAVEQFRFENDPARSSHLLIPGITVAKTVKDNQIFVHQGNRFSFTVQGSLKTGISDNNFMQAEVQDKYIHSVFNNNGRLILSTDIGYTAVSDTEYFPLSLRFYAGGSQSIRGFKYQSRGPGRYIATGSIEYQQRIKGDWYGAIFFDAGNASDEIHTPLERSTGLGIVWASPIGPFELTLAKVLTLPDQPLRIQFTMGPDL